MSIIDISIANLKQRKKDLERYAFIITACRNTDISCDETFQRQFTCFFRVRRNDDWRQIYYRLFEASKENEAVCFESILYDIYAGTGRVEASFTSKMLATLKPEMPIWDSIVLSKLGIVKPAQYWDKEKRLQKSVGIYNGIVSWYEQFDQTPEAQQFIEAFDRAFPEFSFFSRTKKIDFMIWGSGEADLFSQ